MAFDYTIDYAQKAIDLAKAGAADYLVVQALADREKKITDLGLTEKVAGSTTALKDYLGAITAAIKPAVKVEEEAPEVNQLDYTDSTMGEIDYNSDSFGFDPYQYSTTAGSATVSSGSIGNILGYVILGLVGIVVLDKVMG